MVFALITASSVTAVSFSDADGDGLCEPGEEITFYGDPEFDYYDWDFDGDGLPDDNGEVVTYVFETEGIYTVSVVETNGHTEQKILIVVVESEDNQEPNPNEDNKLERKINKILERLYRNNVKINIITKLILKEYRNSQRKGNYEIDPLDVLDFIAKQTGNIKS
jgi:hypothetical protein